MKATAQAKKDKLISKLVETRRKILNAVSALPAEKQDQIFLGAWSVRDLLAHLVGWDFANLGAAKEILDGKLPSFYSSYDRDWKTFNARLVAKYKRGSFADLVSLVEGSHQKLIDFLKIIPAEEFDKDRALRFKGDQVTIAGDLEVEINDEKTHLAQIIEFSNTRKRRRS